MTMCIVCRKRIMIGTSKYTSGTSHKLPLFINKIAACFLIWREGVGGGGREGGKWREGGGREYGGVVGVERSEWASYASFLNVMQINEDY